MTNNVNLIQLPDAKKIEAAVKALINGYTIEIFEAIEGIQLSPAEQENRIEIKITVRVLD